MLCFLLTEFTWVIWGYATPEPLQKLHQMTSQFLLRHVRFESLAQMFLSAYGYIAPIMSAIAELTVAETGPNTIAFITNGTNEKFIDTIGVIIPKRPNTTCNAISKAIYTIFSVLLNFNSIPPIP